MQKTNRFLSIIALSLITLASAAPDTANTNRRHGHGDEHRSPRATQALKEGQQKQQQQSTRPEKPGDNAQRDRTASQARANYNIQALSATGSVLGTLKAGEKLPAGTTSIQVTINGQTAVWPLISGPARPDMRKPLNDRKDKDRKDKDRKDKDTKDKDTKDDNAIFVRIGDQIMPLGMALRTLDRRDNP